MKKLFALLLALALLPCFPAAFAEGEGGVYALMSIPYDLFYAAEVTGGQYDSVSSATMVKPLQKEYVGGSFHFMPDGSEITGVIFPVYAESEALLQSYGGEEITDDTSVTITVENVTATYTGPDALFQSFPFSYYRLEEVPHVFKRLGADSTFGPMEGITDELLGDIRVVESPYADRCVAVENAGKELNRLDVQAVVIGCDDGTRVGMKHLENIWLKTVFGFNLDSGVYALLKGKGIDTVEFYTLEARYCVYAPESVTLP